MSDIPNQPPEASDRLVSLDFYRGLTMFLLIGGGTGLFGMLRAPELEGGFLGFIGYQLEHHEWNGLLFWDLIQPFFMFIVGVAIPFSVANRRRKGHSDSQLLNHALRRAFLLLFLGWALACKDSGRIVFHFQNVLSQLSVTYLIAFLLMRAPIRVQIVASFVILAFTELLFRGFPVAGFNQAFTPDKNIGAWLDLVIGGKLSGGHWINLNALPTAAHTIWGVCAGQILMVNRSSSEKIKALVVGGLVFLALGYGLDSVTPIVKRIATTTFVLASGGWSLLALALCYWIIDVRGHDRCVPFFTIVGKNPLFIYLFWHVGGTRIIEQIATPFVGALFGWTGEIGSGIALGLTVWMGLWYVTYWLDKNKVYVRI
jgi:predicted acyltransferase